MSIYLLNFSVPIFENASSVHGIPLYSKIQKEIQKSTDILGFAYKAGSPNIFNWYYCLLIFFFYFAINTDGHTSAVWGSGHREAGWPTSVSTAPGCVYLEPISQTHDDSRLCIWNFPEFRSHRPHSAVQTLAAGRAVFSLAFSPSEYSKPSVLIVGWLRFSVHWSHNSLEAILTQGNADRSCVIGNNVLKRKWLACDSVSLMYSRLTVFIGNSLK